MAKENPTPDSSLIPQEPVPAEAAAFAHKLHGLLDGQPKDDATVASAFDGMDGMFDLIAVGLYSLASMLVGEGEDSVQLVETAVANAEISASASVEQARHNSRMALAKAAVKLLVERDAAGLAAPENLQPAVTCIEDDDLDAASDAGEELERMIAGPDRDRVRTWLESLPTTLRTIYVLRAVAGFKAQETADLLATQGGPQAEGWTAEMVREFFRQGLCSLASQLIHATAGR